MSNTWAVWVGSQTEEEFCRNAYQQAITGPGCVKPFIQVLKEYVRGAAHNYWEGSFSEGQAEAVLDLRRRCLVEANAEHSGPTKSLEAWVRWVLDHPPLVRPDACPSCGETVFIVRATREARVTQVWENGGLAEENEDDQSLDGLEEQTIHSVTCEHCGWARRQA